MFSCKMATFACAYEKLKLADILKSQYGNYFATRVHFEELSNSYHYLNMNSIFVFYFQFFIYDQL